MKSFFVTIGRQSATIITILTILTLIFKFVLDGHDVVQFFFPHPPLAGAWKGKIEGKEVSFCFEQYGSVVWGEFQWGSQGLVSVDRRVYEKTFELSYERVGIPIPDWGLVRLNYEKVRKS